MIPLHGCVWIFITIIILSDQAYAKYASILIKRELRPCEVEVESSDTEDLLHHGLKECQRKLQISLQMLNFKKTMHGERYIIVDHVYDSLYHERVRLYNPLTIKLSQEHTMLMYPFKHLYSVNNKVYEITIHKDNTKKFKGCQVDDSNVVAACKHSAEDENTWKSAQGFCCACDGSPQNQPYHVRGGQHCGQSSSQSHDQTSAHCLRFDRLWYSVNALGKPFVYHLVHVDVYVERDRRRSGVKRTWAKMNGEDSLRLGTNYTMAFGKKGQIHGSYSPVTLEPDSPSIDYKQMQLLIPEPVELEKGEPMPIQAEQGPEEYLVLDQGQIDASGSQCDKVGVSYQAFISQTDRCQKPAQNCLNNQPMHYWIHDQEKRLQKEGGKYSLSSFGRLSKHPIVHNYNGTQMVSFDYHGNYTSSMTLEINADKVVVLHKGSHGIIEEVSIVSKTSVIKIRAHIFNSGLVSSEYTLRLVGCSDDLTPSEASTTHSAHIGPHDSARFIFKMQTVSSEEGKTVSTNSSSCIAELLNHRAKKIASRELHFRPLDMCFCIAHCHCKCASEPFECDPLSQDEYHMAGYKGARPRPLRDLNMDSATAMEILALVLVALLLLGVFKMLVGLFFLDDVAQFGLCMFMEKYIHEYYEPHLRHYPVFTDGSGNPLHPINRVSPVRQMSQWKEMALNLFFFYYAPFMGCYWFGYRLVDIISYRVKKACNVQPQVSPILPRKKMQELLANEEEDTIYEPLLPHPSTTPKPSVTKATSPESSEGTDGAAEAAYTETMQHQLDKEAVLQQYRKQKKLLTGSQTEITDNTLEKQEEKVESASQNEDESKENDIPLPTPRPASPVSQLTDQDIELLTKFTEPGTAVYFNCTQPNSHLWRSGETFSMCGHIRKARDDYKFTLGPHLTQVYENVNGDARGLTTPLPINPKYFQRTLSAAEVLENISEKPLYACLNYVPDHQ